MIITVKPETAARLHEKAQREGVDPDAIADAVEAALNEPGKGKLKEQVFADLRAKHGLSACHPSVVLTEVAPGIMEVE